MFWLRALRRYEGDVEPDHAARPAVVAVDIPEETDLHKHGRLILFRDSKNPEGSVLAFDKGELAAFVLSAKDGDFDDLLADMRSD
ncbi:DUF397 domain-containing protein [Nonomuraea sp. NPDC050404]|uniref:DUF397 domain-containing protein n=1 Tax=Nonomuraea sp. NPDC050404 TaxID=3155783 RepID=UPI0033CA96AF